MLIPQAPRLVGSLCTLSYAQERGNEPGYQAKHSLGYKVWIPTNYLHPTFTTKK